MPSKWPLVISNVVLGFTSYWALKYTAWFMRYARGAARIHFITGVMATVVYSVPHKGSVHNLLKHIYLWCQCLSGPLVASEVYLRSGYVPDLAPLHLAIPLFVLARFYIHNNELDLDMMAVGQGLAILSLASTSMTSNNVAGIFLTVIYLNTSFRITLFNHFLTGPDSNSDPTTREAMLTTSAARDPFIVEGLTTFTVLMCMVNILLPDALYWRPRSSTSS